MQSVCRVCGYGGDEFYDASGEPTFVICDCCSAESGYQDATPEAARAHRQRWLAEGAKWRSQSQQPVGWDLDDQLAHVPEDYQ